ncbi:MAG: GAF domain-containing protein, partial [Chloroflexota bacterium]
FLMTPMYREGQLIGIIGLRGYETTDMFDENHEKLLDESAKYISVILDNAHKYEGINNNLQQRLKEAQALTRFQEMVGNVEPVQEEIKDIFNEAYETLTQVGIDASNMYIALYRAETNTITFEIVYEHGQPVVLDDAENEDLYKSRHLDERPSLVRWVIKHGEPLLINSSKKFEELQSAGEIDYLPTQSKSWLGVPMQSHKQLFGVIVLRSFETESAFQQSHREFLTSIASYSAIALENSQLFESKQRQTRQAEALARASRGIARAGLDLSVALDVILSQAIEVTNAHLGTLRLTKDNNLELIASHTEIDSEKELVIFPSTIEQTSNHLESQAIEGNLYKIVPDVRQDYTIKALHPLTKSAIAVVIRTGGNENDRTPIGTLYLEHPHLSGFSEADCIIDLANMAAVAIQNAQNEKKLAQSRDYQLASNAVAWLGLFGADWQHTINQKTFSIETYVAGLRRQIRRLGLGTDKNQQIQGVLDEIVAVVADIRDVKFTSQVPQNVPKELKGQTELEVELPLTSGSTAIADEVQDMVERWCRHRSDVKRDYMFDCGDVEAPIAPQWLKVALEKLVNNALKAMPDGGTLTTEAYVRHKQIHIAISDTGKGIPEDVQAYFLKQAIPKNISQTGTGMGSLIARFIALSHGGDLALVHSKPDEGAKLLMTLPLDSDVMHNSAEIT